MEEINFLAAIVTVRVDVICKEKTHDTTSVSVTLVEFLGKKNFC